MLIILEFYPQYVYHPPSKKTSNNYWQDFQDRWENLYSGRDKSINKFYPPNVYSEIGALKYRIDNGFIALSFYYIFSILLYILFFLSIFKNKIFYGFYSIGASYILFSIIMSIFSNNPNISQKTLGFILNIIASLFVLSGFLADTEQMDREEKVTPSVKLIKLIMGIIAGVLVSTSTSFYFTGGSLLTAGVLQGVFPTIYVVVGLVIIILSIFRKDIFIVSLGTMVFFLTLTIWIASSIQSTLQSPGTGMIMMLVGSSICMFIYVLSVKIDSLLKLDLQKSIKDIKDGYSK